MDKGKLAMFVGSTLLSALCATPVVANAGYHRIAGASCSGTSTYYKTLQPFVGAISNDYSGESGFVNCDIPDNSLAPGASITGANAYVEDQSTTDVVNAKACVKFWASTGAACDVTQTDGPASTTGVLYFSFPTSIWQTNSNDFKYISVVLPALTTGRSSELYGYTLTW